MKTTKRFDNAVTKLYNAFHNGELNWSDCRKCVIGVLCNGDRRWHQVLNSGNVYLKNYTGELKQLIDRTGYNTSDLAKIEQLFLTYATGVGQTEDNYKGLCAVVEYLCELDNIPNVMDYTKLFETENYRPKYELQCKTR